MRLARSGGSWRPPDTTPEPHHLQRNETGRRLSRRHVAQERRHSSIGRCASAASTTCSADGSSLSGAKVAIRNPWTRYIPTAAATTSRGNLTSRTRPHARTKITNCHETLRADSIPTGRPQTDQHQRHTKKHRSRLEPKPRAKDSKKCAARLSRTLPPIDTPPHMQ